MDDNTSSLPRSPFTEFGSWLTLESKSLYIRFSIFTALSQLFISYLTDLSKTFDFRDLGGIFLQWLPVAIHGFQAIVILVLVIVLHRRCDAVFKTASSENDKTILLQSDFRKEWMRLWLTWLFLYVGLIAFALIKQLQIVHMQKEYVIKKYHVLGQVVELNRKNEKNTITSIAGIKNPYISEIAEQIKKHDYCYPSPTVKTKKGEQIPKPVDCPRSYRLGLHDLPYFLRNEEQSDFLNTIVFKIIQKEKLVSEILLDEIKLYDHFDRLMQTSQIENTVLNFINNLQSAQFLICYLILLQRPRYISGIPKELFVCIAIVPTIIETILVSTAVGGQMPLQFLNAFSSLLGGVIIALFTGRLESRALRAPFWLIIILYIYATLQIGWAISLTTVLTVYLRSILYFFFTISKVLLFLFILWLLQSGRMLYYLNYRLHDEKNTEQSTSDFLLLVTPSDEFLQNNMRHTKPSQLG